MKASAFGFGIAGAMLLLVLAMSGSIASESVPHPIKTGLWEVEWHTNWAMFVVRHDQQPPDERARVSAQALEHPLYKRACVTDAGAVHPDLVVLKYEGCKLQTRPAGDGVATLDGMCNSRKDGITQLHVRVTSKSPGTAVVDLKGTLDPAAGYPVIETYKMRWISEDCGDLAPGAIRSAPPPKRAN